jgi:hypothetical protein
MTTYYLEHRYKIPLTLSQFLLFVPLVYGILAVLGQSKTGNNNRIKLWKTELQKLATETVLLIRVAHLPPGTSKWNKIELCHITENWRGRPLINREVAVNLISNTTTSKGLKLQANLGEAEYPIEKKISDKDLKKVHFHGEWNYSILPNID